MRPSCSRTPTPGGSVGSFSWRRSGRRRAHFPHACRMPSPSLRFSSAGQVGVASCAAPGTACSTARIVISGKSGCSVGPYIHSMDAPSLLASLHGQSLRRISRAAGSNFAGLQVAGRRCHPSPQPCKALTRLDHTVALNRHITEPRAREFVAQLDAELIVFASSAQTCAQGTQTSISVHPSAMLTVLLRPFVFEPQSEPDTLPPADDPSLSQPGARISCPGSRRRRFSRWQTPAGGTRSRLQP